MSKRYIQQPPSTNLRINGVDYDFTAFIVFLVDNGRRFNENGPGLRMGVRIVAAASESPIVLDEDDWKALHEEAEHPTNGYCPGDLNVGGKPLVIPARLFFGYVDALSDPPNRPPADASPSPKPAAAARRAKRGRASTS